MYIKVNKKLEQIRPTPKQLAEEEERSIAQNEKMDKEFGYYEKMSRRKADDKDNILLSTRYLSKEDARNGKEDRLDEIGTSSSLEEAKEKIGDTKEKMLETELKKGNLVESSEITDTYIEMYGNDFDKSDEKEIKDIEKLKEEIDKTIQNNEYADRTYSADELAERDVSILEELESLSRGENIKGMEERARESEPAI